MQTQSIFGVTIATFSLALAGPIIGGWLYDILQDYRLASFIASAVCAAGGIGFAFMTRIRQLEVHAPTQEEAA